MHAANQRYTPGRGVCGPAVLFAAVVAATTGCAQPSITNAFEYHAQKGRGTPVIQVENRSRSPIIVRTAQMRIGRVEVGETLCLLIPGVTGHMQLLFDIDQERYASQPFFPLEGSGGWEVEIGNMPSVDIWSLVPAPRCRV